ncbi:glycosyltransferase family 2 protein [Vulcanisaeta thermophila]|uniref:glycosyltransferase family 2 protein n=1 Tax=Vulcanisaeta thermophila TaxID=867917 RepID=UPI00138A42E4|nr:glycosyltransferase [Vulcanisaeta thermophila]
MNLEVGNFRKSVLIVDGHSTDASPELIRNEVEGKPNVYFIRLDGNGGYAGNNVEGYKYAVNVLGADYVVFMNNDFIAEPDSLRRMFDYLVKNEYTGVQGLELRPDGLIGNAGMMHDEFARVVSICGGTP